MSVQLSNVLKRSFASKDRVAKPVKPAKSVYRPHHKQKIVQETLGSSAAEVSLTSPIVTMIVGSEQRIFAAHEDILCHSPFFAAAIKAQYLESGARLVKLPDMDPQVLSCILEFLYKGDYCSRADVGGLGRVEDSLGGHGWRGATLYSAGAGGDVLRDTAVYCAAEKCGLEGLKRLALRQQGQQCGIPVDVILRSARYAYEHTPATESRLRAHYLALIIRSRKTFKRSGTMQMEMERGGQMFFDLFAAMCNHIDDVVEMSNSRSPRM